MLANNKRILVAVPEKLLSLADEAARALQMSRVSFIRQAIAMRVASFHRSERPALGGFFEEKRYCGVCEGSSSGSEGHQTAPRLGGRQPRN